MTSRFARRHLDAKIKKNGFLPVFSIRLPGISIIFHLYSEAKYHSEMEK